MRRINSRRSAVVLAIVAATGASAVAPTVAHGLYANPNPIAIPDVGPASPYPSTINVDKLLGVPTKVTVRLSSISHTDPGDIQALLVGPGGQKSFLIDARCSGLAMTSRTFTFDDTAGRELDPFGPCGSGTFRPNYDGAPSLPAPAPPAPYQASLSVFNGASPNGAWSLFVNDSAAMDTGVIGSGWRLTLTLTGSCGGQVATHVVNDATLGEPSLNGNVLPNVILGSDADDTLRGLRGNDVICGGGGDDTLRGSGGRDTLLGDDGDDLLIGGGEGDRIGGGGGDDKLKGESGRDRLRGQKGDDLCHGGAGSDRAKTCEKEKKL